MGPRSFISRIDSPVRKEPCLIEATAVWIATTALISAIVICCAPIVGSTDVTPAVAEIFMICAPRLIRQRTALTASSKPLAMPCSGPRWKRPAETGEDISGSIWTPVMLMAWRVDPTSVDGPNHRNLEPVFSGVE